MAIKIRHKKVTGRPIAVGDWDDEHVVEGLPEVGEFYTKTQVDALIANLGSSVVTLQPLSLSPLTINEDASFVGTITGRTSGSIVTATVSDGTVLTVLGNSVTGTFATPGTVTVSLNEVLAGANNTPRLNVFSVIVVDVIENPQTYDATLPVPEIVLDTDYNALTFPITNFFVDYPPTSNTTDTLRLSVKTLPSLTEVLNSTFTGTGPITFPGLSSISTGSHQLSIRLERGNSYGPSSNVINHGPDNVAPLLTLPTGVGTGSTTATISVTTDEDSGILYYLVNTSATATKAQVKAGTSTSVVSNGIHQINITGLTPSTPTLYAHFVQTDMSGNDRDPVHSESFATQSAPVLVPQWDSSKSSNQLVFSGNPLLTVRGTDNGGQQVARTNVSIDDDATATISLIMTLGSGEGSTFGFGVDDIPTNNNLPANVGFSGVTFGTWGYQFRQAGVLTVEAYDYENAANSWATGDQLVLAASGGSIQVKRIRSGTTTTIGAPIAMPIEGQVFGMFHTAQQGANTFTAAFTGF